MWLQGIQFIFNFKDIYEKKRQRGRKILFIKLSILIKK